MLFKVAVCVFESSLINLVLYDECYSILYDF